MGIQETTKRFWIDKTIGIVHGTAEAYAREYYPGIEFGDVFGNNGKHYRDNDNNPAIYEYLEHLIAYEFDVDPGKAWLISAHIKVQYL